MTDIGVKTLPPAQLERVYRRNFWMFLLDGVFFIVALSVMGPTTLIPDFIRRLTSSEVLIGFSSSLFDVGAMLPQLFVARYLVRLERKKRWFVIPNIPVRLAFLVFAAVVFLVSKEQPGLILLAFLICYGAAAFGDGFVGVSWSDLLGSSLDNRWRARVFGWMSAISGIVMLGAAPLIAAALGHPALDFPDNYALIFGAAGLLFALSILPGFFIHELPGGKAVDRMPTLGEFMPQLGQMLRANLSFRYIVITRMLTILFAMAGPFYIGYATEQLGLSSEVAVPGLLAMQTIGSISGALLYTWIGAHNNLLYIRLALSGATLLPISALLTTLLGPPPLYIGFLMSGLALSNLFLSYQNWVLTHAPADQRPIHAGLFNTISAIASLIAPIIGGLIAQQLGYQALFVVALVMILGALFVTLRYLRPPQPQHPD